MAQDGKNGKEGKHTRKGVVETRLPHRGPAHTVILHGGGAATGPAPVVPVEVTPRPRPFRG